MKMNDEIWEAAEFITEWDAAQDDGSNIRYKLFFVPRRALDTDEDGEPLDVPGTAHLLLGINDGNVREVDIVLDNAFDRTLDSDERDAVEAALENAPDDATEILFDYLYYNF